MFTSLDSVVLLKKANRDEPGYRKFINYPMSEVTKSESGSESEDSVACRAMLDLPYN